MKDNMFPNGFPYMSPDITRNLHVYRFRFPTRFQISFFSYTAFRVSKLVFRFRFSAPRFSVFTRDREIQPLYLFNFWSVTKSVTLREKWYMNHERLICELLKETTFNIHYHWHLPCLAVYTSAFQILCLIKDDWSLYVNAREDWRRFYNEIWITVLILSLVPRHFGRTLSFQHKVVVDTWCNDRNHVPFHGKKRVKSSYM